MFRRFIYECQKTYSAIYVYEIWNPILKQALVRYGFMPMVRFERNERIDGMKWLDGWFSSLQTLDK